MRLSKIKLAGFKSFVDPTTINLPSNLTGIVGPNGCGKSNVIDAVRWVMGESSAKHLRGSSMDDVIFNGSSARKPVGLATVELIFDNSAGKLGGQFAQYSEISVKRSVARDGQSKYSLNGTRCRRRDIADLFLGTGLGPRSYAIIEQGMISRLIEAKPEELRVFLEEAAGISKYKERRKETETRIRHTRENLDRLQDLREEIDTQLARLKRQSRAAEKYKELKNDERTLKAEQLALRWREHKHELDKRDREIGEAETRLEKVIADQRATESKIVEHREEHTEANDTLNAVQGQFYSIGAEISSIEQNIKHQQDLQQRQQADLQQIETALEEDAQALQNDSATLEQVRQQLTESKPQLETLRVEEKELEYGFQSAEEAMQDWQQSWDESNQVYSETSQRAEVENSRMEQLERHVDQLQQRLIRIDVEQKALSGEDVEAQLAELASQLSEAEREKTTLENKQLTVLESVRDIREQIVADEKTSSEQRRSINECQGRLSSLDVLQQSALGKTDQLVKQWLERQGLDERHRFAEQIKVENGWEAAVETVLGDTLEAICVDNFDNLRNTITELTQSNLSLIETGVASAQTGNSANDLQDKVNTSPELGRFFQGIRIAETLNEAFQVRSSLAINESVVTKDGIWMGSNWLRITKDKDARQGVLARETEIRELNQQLEVLEQGLKKQSDDLNKKREMLQTREQQREEIQQELNQFNTRLNEIHAQVSARETRQEHISDRGQSLGDEKAEIVQMIQDEQDVINSSSKNRDEALQVLETLEVERQKLESQRESLRDQLQQHRTALQQQRNTAQELAIKIEGLNTHELSLKKNIERMQRSQESQIKRRQELQELLSKSSEPVANFEQELKELLEKRLTTEETLAAARRKVDAVAQLLITLEQQRTECEELSQKVRNQLEKIRLDSQEIRVRSKTVLEQLAESGHEASVLLEQLEEGASNKEWEEKVAAIGQRISRLGAINLAAIDEFREQQTRKEYLDEQYKDITSALDTLEKAIAKIDRETRGRFKDTYEHVNTRLQEMFPRLFGGGTAHLEMTGDDLLSTGIAVMARPPGKRISNIHLMSGGEKALTAVALVFAIFELNPAPFCMLDEVDAPLDEANVGRFGQLLREMSENIQFIYITHNKSTMEISEHLSGVTMREAGVSRLVTVDVAEAATMAAV